MDVLHIKSEPWEKPKTLQDLWNALRSLKGPTIVDLHGCSLSGVVSGLRTTLVAGNQAIYDKHLVIDMPDLTIQKVTVELQKNYAIIITAPNVTFKNVKVVGEGLTWRRRSVYLVRVTGSAISATFDTCHIESQGKQACHALLVDSGAKVNVCGSLIHSATQGCAVKVLNASASLSNGTRVLGGLSCTSVQLHTPETSTSNEPGEGYAANIRHKRMLVASEEDEALLGAPSSDPATDAISEIDLNSCELSGGVVATIATFGKHTRLLLKSTSIISSNFGVLAGRGSSVEAVDCQLNGASQAAVVCSGATFKGSSCTFSGSKTGVLSERRGVVELDSAQFCGNQHSAVSHGAGAVVRAVDCAFDVEPLGQSGGMVVREDGQRSMFSNN